MAVAVCTISTCYYNSSSPGNLAWYNITTGNPSIYVDVTGKDASKLIFLVAHETTKVGAGSTWYIGCSDTDTTGTSDKAFSAGKLGRIKVKQAKYAKAKAQTAIGRCTSSTRLVSIAMLGPFETARFKTTDGRIYLSKGKTGSTASRIAAILLP